MNKKVISALESLGQIPWPQNLSKNNLGLLANQAAVDSNYRPALEILDELLPNGVTTLFGAQHGFRGEKQDNMIESSHEVDEKGRPIFSLYGETRKPSPKMLKNLEALIIDLPDVGTRVYTFAQTMALCLEACGELGGPEVVILDRPNPLGGEAVEGNIIDSSLYSFVGLYPIPMRHGLSLGELALFINKRLKKPAKLSIVPCQNWKREQLFKETALPWVLPSPNLPNPVGALVYPGQVLWEGTNISEGRGTTLPFQLFGAPFIKNELLLKGLKNLKGFMARKASFQPTFHKWAGQLCEGLELIPTDKSFKPYLTSLTILEIILKYWPEEFKLKEPPYEYEFEKRPLDLILGSPTIFNDLKNGRGAQDLASEWRADELSFKKECQEFYLYK